MTTIPGMVSVAKWLGRTGEPLEPESMQYRAKVAAEGSAWCSGCVFKGQASKVCIRACAAAVRAGLPDCEDKDPATGRTHIYLAVETDPRQIDLTKE